MGKIVFMDATLQIMNEGSVKMVASAGEVKFTEEGETYILIDTNDEESEDENSEEHY